MRKKVEVDIKTEFNDEEFEKELEELEEKVAYFLQTDPDTRYEMTKFDFYRKK